MCRPVLTTENVVSIQGGRHPLAELVVPPDSPFIPNDTHMGAADGRVHVITGK
jgi:DNA mismatch repair protein MutS